MTREFMLKKLEELHPFSSFEFYSDEAILEEYERSIEKNLYTNPTEPTLEKAVQGYGILQ